MTPPEAIHLAEWASQYKGPGEGETSRKVLRNWMIGIFLGLNITTMGLLYWVHWDDVHGPSDPPLVTSAVLMTLIGATAVQVGSAMVMIVGFFFKGTPAATEDESLEES